MLAQEQYNDICINCADQLYRFALFMLSDSDKAGELVTQACVEGKGKLKDMDREEQVKIVLFKIILQYCLSTLMPYNPELLIAAQPKLQGKQDLFLALASLGKVRRSVVILRFCVRLDYQEVQDIAGLPPWFFKRILLSSISKVKCYLNYRGK